MKKSLTKSLTILATVAMCITAMTGCNGNSQGASSNADVYKIGGMGPLTGGAASYGISVKQGAEIAIEEINATGGVNGKKLELIFEDDQNDVEKSISAYNKVMDQGVTAILGAVTSGCSIAVGEESIKDGILQITPSGSALNCTQYENAFRICFTDPVQGETMANYIADQGHKSVAIIYNIGDEYSKGITEAFVKQAEARGLKIAAQESFNTDDVDFKTQLTKIKGTDADSLFLPIYYSEVAAISEQAKTVGLSLPYFGCDGWDGVIAQLNGDTANIEGAIFLTPFVASVEDEKTKAFVDKYKAAYTDEPSQFAADGYDGIYAIKLAIEECGDDVTNENLIAAMTKINVSGLTGGMTFTADGEPNKSTKFATIKDGQYVMLG